jgi:hypothetical protein
MSSSARVFTLIMLAWLVLIWAAIIRLVLW